MKVKNSYNFKKNIIWRKTEKKRVPEKTSLQILFTKKFIHILLLILHKISNFLFKLLRSFKQNQNHSTIAKTKYDIKEIFAKRNKISKKSPEKNASFYNKTLNWKKEM